MGVEISVGVGNASTALVGKGVTIGGEATVASGVFSSPLQATRDRTSTAKDRMTNDTLLFRWR